MIHCDGIGVHHQVMNTRGTWWYLRFPKEHEDGRMCDRTLMHIKYSWAVLHFLAFCEIRLGPYNGVLAKRMWAERKPLLGVTVLKSSFFLFCDELRGHMFQSRQKMENASRLTSDDGISENTHLLCQVTDFPAFICDHTRASPT